MDLPCFAVWKFRYIEGFLQDMHSYDVLTTKYVNPKTFVITWIKYDLDKDRATIETEGRIMECRLSELEKTLKDLGMYRERPENDRHALSGPQKKPE